MKRPLPTAGPGGLGAATIMDRALAHDHGPDYVRLVAFAVDLDRLYGRAPAGLAFGWEVFVVERYLLGALDAGDASIQAMLEDACMSVLEQPPEQARLGSHLVFAVHDAVQRGLLPSALGVVFHRWRSAPKQLSAELDALWRQAGARLPELASACLRIELDPPASPTTVQALEQMARGQWPPTAVAPGAQGVES